MKRETRSKEAEQMKKKKRTTPFTKLMKKQRETGGICTEREGHGIDSMSMLEIKMPILWKYITS